MKKLQSLALAGMILLSEMISAQCTNSSAYTSGTAGSPGSTVQITSCTWAGEYNAINGVTAGSNMLSYTNISGDFITIRSGSATGPVVASGTSPLAWVAPSTTTYYEHINTNSLCGTQSSCRGTFIVNMLGCTNSTVYTTVAAPSVGQSVQTSTCTFAGEYNQITSVLAANVYSSSSTISTDYITIHQGSPTGPIVAAGLTPLTWTAGIAGTYYEHINTNSSCGTANSCRDIFLRNITPVPPANDNCSGATNILAGGTATGTTFNASNESPAPSTCAQTLNQPGVWYTVTGNGNRFGADLCATSSWDSKIFVFMGGCTTTTCVTSNDDGGPMCVGAAASVTWCSAPGIVYRILVTGYSSPSDFTITLTQTAVPAISASAGSVCAGSTFTIVPSGASSYTYSSGSNTVAPTSNTSYTVNGTTAGCVSFSPAIITVTAHPLPVISAANASVCSGSSHTFSPTGAVNYTYSGGSNIVTPSSNTTYSIGGTNSFGCNASSPAVVTVSVMARPVITAPNGTICAGEGFTFTPQGAMQYTYSSGSHTVSPTSNSTYSIYGTALNGCPSTTATIVNVTVNPVPVVAAASGSICEGSSFVINPSGATTYSYSNGSATVSPVTTTSYSVTGSFSTGCTSTPVVVNVSVAPSPVISVNSGSICEGGSFVMTPSGATTFTYSNGSATVSPVTTTSYSVTGTSPNGCVSPTAAVANVTVAPAPVLSVNSGSICAGSSFTITASGASTFSYSSGTNVVNPPVTTAYSVTGTSPLGCISLSPAVSNVTVYTIPSVVLTGTTEACMGNSVTITATGADTFSWTNGFNGSSAVITVSANSQFTVIGSNNGCLDSATYTLTANPNPVINISATSPTICVGETLSLIAEGAASYQWSAPGASSGTVVVSPTTTTAYSVTGSDIKGCTDSESHIVNVAECAGLKDGITKSQFAVAPNPNNGEFYLSTGISGEYEITVIDVTSRLVHRESVSDRGKVNISRLANGVYYIRIAGINSGSVKIIKQ